MITGSTPLDSPELAEAVAARLNARGYHVTAAGLLAGTGRVPLSELRRAIDAVVPVDRMDGEDGGRA